MKFSLERADARALRVDLPGAGNPAIAIRAAQGLRGAVEQDGDRLVFSDVAAESLEIETLRILLGELVLACPDGATMTGLGLALEQTKTELMLAVTTASL